MGPHRKILLESPKFVYCSKADIIILQGRSSPMPSGIPTFSVQILNMCGNSNNGNNGRQQRRRRRHSCETAGGGGGAAVSDVHVSCGWFASAKLVNPRVFRRIKYNDCLVNDGAPIRAGEGVTFQYSNSFQYPLTVSAAAAAAAPPPLSADCADHQH